LQYAPLANNARADGDGENSVEKNDLFGENYDEKK
jgi:hypothetical protein